MCFGNDAPEMQQIPKPPPEKEMMDFISHITGSQTVTVTGADWVKKRVTTRVPKNAEDQALIDEGKNLLITSTKQLGDLFKYDPKSIISFSPLVNTFANLDEQRLQDLGQFANIGQIEQQKQQFQNMQKSLIDEQFALREQANEERLAHTGRGSGTYAAESRAAMARAHGLARAEGDSKAHAYAEELAAKRLGTNKEAFGLREAGRQGTLEATQAEYALNKADEQDQEARRQQAIQEKKGLFDLGANIVRYDDSVALQDQTHRNSLDTYLAENNVQNTRYGHQVNAIAANNKMAQDQYNNRPPSFGEWALNTGSALGTAYLTGGMNSASGGNSGGLGGLLPGNSNSSRVGRDTTGIMYPGKRI